MGKIGKVSQKPTNLKSKSKIGENLGFLRLKTGKFGKVPQKSTNLKSKPKVEENLGKIWNF